MMRHYGMQGRGLVLDLNEFYDLCINKRKYVNDDITELCSYLYDEETNTPLGFGNVSIDTLLDIAYNIDYAYTTLEVDGTFNKYDKDGVSQDTRYFNGDDIIVIELMKDTLFDKYESFDEIYEELRQDLLEVGIEVDVKYIEDHFGNFEGSFYA